jgi:predicted Zn-dependent protease
MGVRTGTKISWWSKEARYLAYWAIVMVALQGAAPARAGSIVLTVEWLEKWGAATGADGPSPGITELEQATKYFKRKEFGACLEQNASIAEGRGDWRAARSALEAWLTLEPTNALVRQRLGKVLFRVGERKVAYQELVRAASEDSTVEPAAITMGWLYTRANDPATAREWMEYAAKVAPESPGVRIGLAAWLLERGRPDEAQAHAETAVRLAPKSQDARRLLAVAARARRDLVQSESILRALAAESPGAPWVRNELALALAEQSDDAKRREALELAEVSIRHAPGDPEAMATLGMVSFHLHRLDAAGTLLQAAVDSGHASPDAAYVLARVRAEAGQTHAVTALLEPALAAPGLFVFRAQAKEWLDRLATRRKSGS